MTSYSPKVLEHYEKEFKYYNHKLYEYFTNNQYIINAAQESSYFSDDAKNFLPLIKQIGKDIFSFVKGLFHVVSKVVLKLTHNYDLLFNKYSKFIYENKSDIDEDKFGNTVVKCVPKNVLLKRINIVNKLFAIITNIELVINNSDKFEGSTAEECFDMLTDIGYDISGSLSNKPAHTYQNSSVKDSISNLDYKLSDLLSTINNLKGINKYTSRSFINNTNKSFINISNKLTNEQKNLDKDDPEYKEIRSKLMKLWWCSHFIKATYTIANDVVHDLLVIAEVASKSISKKQENTTEYVNPYVYND